MENPDIAALQAAGAMDKAPVRQLARIFGGGQRGIERAAAVAEETGVMVPGRLQSLSKDEFCEKHTTCNYRLVVVCALLFCIRLYQTLRL